MSKYSEGEEITCIACSVFKKEIEALKEKGIFQFRTRYIRSFCRSGTRKFDSLLQEARKERSRGKNVVLLCGCCSPEVSALTADEGIRRVRGANCFEILLGSERYRKLLNEGVRFLLPEWLLEMNIIDSPRRGESSDGRQLPDDECLSPQPLGEAEKIVYINTGLIPLPVEHISQLTIRLQLPAEVIDISLNNLYRSIREAIGEFSRE